MPQNAIIRADGTGDYTSFTAWEAAEQSVDYGSITVARVDGFFDLGASQLDINGTWPNGFRIECFDSADKFDGTERGLCGITSTASITFRNRGHDTELSGIEVHNTGTGIGYSNTVVGGNLDHQDCLFKTVSNTAHRTNTTAGAGTSGCVMASSTGNPNLGGTYNQCSMFTNRTSAIGASSTTAIDNTVIVNLGSGTCYRGTVTQNNNASTDATADTLTNIVIADNFVSANPVVDGDYRIQSGSSLDTNNIGPFVESAGAGTSASIDSQMPSMGSSISATITIAASNISVSSIMPSMEGALSSSQSAPQLDLSISSVMPTMDSSITTNVIRPGFDASMASVMPSMSSSLTLNQVVSGISAHISSTMPSMNSALSSFYDLPVFGSDISSIMPSMESAITLQNDTVLLNSSINSTMPSMTSLLGVTIAEPVNLNVDASSQMPSMGSSLILVNGEIQRIGKVTLSFVESEISVQYNQSTINLEYGA